MADQVLHDEIRALIVEALQLEGIEPGAIEVDVPIFENPRLGIDSVDALELVVALQKRYGVRIDDQNLAREVLRTVETMATFVETARAEAAGQA